MIVAAIALTFALVGTSVAANPTTRAISKSKVKTIAKKQIAKAASGLKVAKANEATTAANATNATNATSAETAKTATTVAYRTFNANGMVADPGLVKNLTNANVVKGNAAGIYCFEGLSFTPKNATVSGLNGRSLTASTPWRRCESFRRASISRIARTPPLPA